MFDDNSIVREIGDCESSVYVAAMLEGLFNVLDDDKYLKIIEHIQSNKHKRVLSIWCTVDELKEGEYYT